MKRKILRCSRFLFTMSLSFFVMAVSLSPGSARAEERPSDVIRKFNAALLHAMKDADELGYAGRYKTLEPVIKDSFAIQFMAAQSAGKYWNTFTGAQRDLFLKTYTEWTIATYAGRFDGYSGEKFEVVPESAPAQGTTTVISRLIQPKGEPIAFHYVLRKIADKWRLVDIKISGVSQLALTRAQFTGVLKDKGFDSLISMLKEKIKVFSRSKKG